MEGRQKENLVPIGATFFCCGGKLDDPYATNTGKHSLPFSHGQRRGDLYILLIG